MTIYNLGNIKGEKGDRGECSPGPTGPTGVGIQSIEQITTLRFKICLTDGSEYYINYGGSTPTPASMSLTGDVSTLMAGETVHLMAAVYDENHNLIPGQIVTMGVYKVSDDSLVESLTVTDMGNGTYTANYTGNCIGDLYVKADCMLLTETYSVKCSTYQSLTSNADEELWIIPSSAGVSYSDNGMTLQGTAWSDCFLNVPIITPASIEFDLTNYSGEMAYLIYLWDSTKTNRIFHLYTRLNNTYLDYYPSESNYISNYTIPIGSHVKIVVNSNNVELYVDGVLKLTKSDYSVGSSFFFEVSTSTGRSTTYKNLKIEPL